MKNIIFYITVIILLTVDAAAQTWQWSKQFGGNDIDQITKLCNDNNGNVYIGGTYKSDPCYFGSDSLLLLPGAQNGFFLTKYNSSGSVQWLNGYAGGSQDSLYAALADITFDSINNYIYVTGSFNGSGNIGGISLSANSTNVLIAKYDLSGNCIWARQAGGPCVCFASAICVNENGDIFITGQNQCTATFGTVSIAPGYFLAKYDTSGNCLWAKKKFNPNMSSYGYDAVLWSLEAKGTDVFGFGGCTVDTFTVDTTTVHGNFANGQYLLARFDSGGTVQWTKACAGDFIGAGVGLAVDEYKNSYITGSFSQSAIFGNDTIITDSNVYSDLFFAKYDSSGLTMWAKQANASYFAIGRDIALSNDGNAYLIGAFLDTAIFDTDTIISTIAGDMFLAKYDTGGNYIIVVQVANGGGSSISLDSNNSIYITGGFSGSVTFDSNPTLTSYGFSDILVAKSNDITGEEEAPRLAGSNQLFIYANPTTGICNVTIPNEFKHEKNLTLQIFDNTGKLLQNIPVQMDNEKVRLNLEQEARGVYHITLSNGRKVYSGKIVFE